MPGFPKALARTLHELRLAGVRSAASHDADGERIETPNVDRRRDLGRLLARVEEQLGSAASTIARRSSASPPRRAAPATCGGRRLPILLLDVPIDSRAEQEFVAALVAQVARRAGHRSRRRRVRARRARSRSAAIVEQP